MENRDIKMVIWDGDQTIWDWIGYAAPAYEAMAECIAKMTNKPLEHVIQAMQDFYTASNTIENERLIQGLEEAGFFKDVKNYDKTVLIQQSKQVFSLIRKENLHVYPGIKNTIHKIHEYKIPQIILSDATAVQAIIRLRFSRLTGFFDKLVAMPSAEIDDLPKGSKKIKVNERYNVSFKVEETIVEKPHTDLKKILGMTYEEIAHHVVIIGDNTQKDMKLAEKYQCSAIHAAYGMPTSDSLTRIAKFAPKKVMARNTSIGDNQFSSTNSKIKIVKDPSKILEALGLAA